MRFEDLYQQYWQKVFRLCMGYVNDFEQAQDLAQETFIKVWEKGSTFRKESGIGTWIFRIASNTCLRQIEKAKKQVKVDLPADLKEEQPVSMEPQIQLLYRFVSELPEIDRILISLELEGVKQAEISRIVGLAEGNVRVKIHRIKEKLTQKFKAHES